MRFGLYIWFFGGGGNCGGFAVVLGLTAAAVLVALPFGLAEAEAEG